MYLTVDLLTDINNIITGLNNITLRKVNVKPYQYEKKYMDKDFKKNKLYPLIDEFNERKINHRDFCSILLKYIHSFYDRNGRTCKILFVSSFN